jgi:gamma-glutamyltranspeptidase/glutathione hydrolase
MVVAAATLALLAGSAARVTAADTHGGVASEDPRATAIGLDVLRRGGNAVDAAIAVSYAVCIVNLTSCGIGGGGFMLIDDGRGEVQALDYREVAPGRAHRDLYRRDGAIKPELSRAGALAVGVPGEIAGLEAARERYARLPRAELMAPAIALARDGFAIGGHLAKAIATNRESVRAVPALAELLLKADGTPRAEGETLKLPALAATLARVAEHGAEAFYRGPVAAEIARAVKAGGGIIEQGDLAGYRPVWRKPLRAPYRGFTLFTMPPPSSGGVLIEMLNVLAADDLRALGTTSPDYLHLLAEAMKQGFADRARWYGDPAFTDVPLARLTSADYARALRARIQPDKVLAADRYGSVDAGTTHLSVIDGAGMTVGCTTTINTAFGAMFVAGDTGILLNNEMDDFATAPGVPNVFGLVGAEANAIAAGKRPLSSMSPVIAVGPGGRRLVAGGSGGPLIVSGVLQTLLGAIDFGLDPEAAVRAPRIHDQWAPPVLLAEEAVPATALDALRTRGHTVRTMPFVSAVQVVERRDGRFLAAGDPRKGGSGATW